MSTARRIKDVDQVLALLKTDVLDPLDHAMHLRTLSDKPSKKGYRMAASGRFLASGHTFTLQFRANPYGGHPVVAAIAPPRQSEPDHARRAALMPKIATGRRSSWPRRLTHARGSSARGWCAVTSASSARPPTAGSPSSWSFAGRT